MIPGSRTKLATQHINKITAIEDSLLIVLCIQSQQNGPIDHNLEQECDVTEKDTDTASLEVLRRLVGQGESRPKVKEAPLVLTKPAMDDTSFEKVRPNDDTNPKPVTKKQVNLRVDPDIIAFFKEAGAGHLTRMHSVLRAHVDAECKKSK